LKYTHTRTHTHTQVEALSAADVSSFVADGLKRTPSIVSYGSMASAPRLGGVAMNKRLA